MSRLPAAARTLVSSASRSPTAAVLGLVDTSHYTDTGGSGADDTSLSTSLEAASRKSVVLYRRALKDIPNMRKNFNIFEDSAFVRNTIREQFERHRLVSDPKIVDMLVFKADQELREIREQWKSRHHVYAYLYRYSEKVMREAAARRLQSGKSDGKDEALNDWRRRGLVPNEIITWPMFLRWKHEEDAKFNAFALEHNLFTSQQLDRNSNASSRCAIM